MRGNDQNRHATWTGNIIGTSNIDHNDSDQTTNVLNQQAKTGQTTHRVARNAGIYLAVQIISWFVTFVSISIVPRHLGAIAYGELILASATTLLVFNIGGFCLDSFLIREIGRDIRQADTLVWATLGLRLTIMAGMLIASYFALRAIHASSVVMTYGIMYLPAMVITVLSEPWRSVLAGAERAREVSLTDLLLSSSPLLAVPFLEYGAKALIVSYTVVQVVGLALRVYWSRGLVRPRPTFDVRLWSRLIRGGLPFMLNNYVAFFYNYITLLILNHFMQESAVGEYSQANKLMGTFVIIPTVITYSLLPVLTRLADSDADAFAKATIRVLVVLIVSCLPIITGVILLATPLCHVLYGTQKFTHVAGTLQMGALLLLPLYIVSTVYQFLVAQNRNAIWSFVLLGTVILHTSLAWILVPYTMRTLHNGIVGVTTAMTIAEFVAAGFAFALLRVNPFNRELIGRVLRGAIATAAMGLVTWALREQIGRLSAPVFALAALQLFVPAIVGSAVFLLAAGWLRAFPPQEQEMVVRALMKRLGRSA